MTQSRSLIVLVIAVLLGLAAVYIANSYLSRQDQEKATATVGTAKIYVAAVPLPFGAVITPEKVKLVDWPAASVPPGSFNAPEQLTAEGKARVVIRQMELNEPILASKVSGEGGRATLSAVLRPNMRATAVRVSDVAAAGGFVLPGDTVDVLITRQLTSPMGGSQQVTDVLLQGVRVIAIDQNANDNAKDPQVGKSATLEVSQIDAQKLTLGQSVGALTLVLRQIGEEPNPDVRTVGIEDLRDGAYVGGYNSRGPGYMPPGLAGLPFDPAPAGGSAPPMNLPAYKPRPSGPTVSIVRGTASTSYEVSRYGKR